MTIGDMIFLGAIALVFVALGAAFLGRIEELISWIRILVMSRERTK